MGCSPELDSWCSKNNQRGAGANLQVWPWQQGRDSWVLAGRQRPLGAAGHPGLVLVSAKGWSPPWPVDPWPVQAQAHSTYQEAAFLDVWGAGGEVSLKRPQEDIRRKTHPNPRWLFPSVQTSTFSKTSFLLILAVELWPLH